MAGNWSRGRGGCPASSDSRSGNLDQKRREQQGQSTERTRIDRARTRVIREVLIHGSGHYKGRLYCKGENQELATLAEIQHIHKSVGLGSMEGS